MQVPEVFDSSEESSRSLQAPERVQPLLEHNNRKQKGKRVTERKASG